MEEKLISEIGIFFPELWNFTYFHR